MKRFPRLPALAALLGCVTAGPALAAGAKAIATYKDWSAHVIAEKSGKTCYMHGTPKKSEGKYTSRGATYVQVAHRTKAKATDEVSVTAGYPYQKGSEVKITIDGKHEFDLFTDDDTAWSRDAAGDRALAAAMRAGTVMVVKGTSTRGTLTTDTYSLAGFTAAHEAIGKACKIK